MTAALMNTYQPLALSFTKGLGTRLWDQAGREYLDAVAGVAVTNVGHSHPRIVAAISEQAGLLLHTSNLYSIDWQQQLAKRLTALSGMQRAFFNNSGAEANETALKLARLYGWRKGIEQPLVVVMANAFHGRTLGTLSASDGPAVRLGFNELPGDFIKVPFGDLAALEQLQRQHGERIVAILVEPIQGESGVQLAPAGYLKALRGLCDRHAWLLMLDEIQTGIGRTGKLFGHEHAGIAPDIMTLGKGIGGGVPLAALLATEHASCFDHGDQGGTFNGNPLMCAAGLVVLDQIGKPDFLKSVTDTGLLLERELQRLSARHGLGEIRGRGLLLALDALLCVRQVGGLLRVPPGQGVALGVVEQALEVVIDAQHAADHALGAAAHRRRRRFRRRPAQPGGQRRPADRRAGNLGRGDERRGAIRDHARHPDSGRELCRHLQCRRSLDHPAPDHRHG